MGWINLCDPAPPGFFDGVHDTDPYYISSEEEAAMSKETYIGDGVYASFDGWTIKLRTRHEQNDRGDHVIYLEPGVYVDLVTFADRCFDLKPKEQPKPVTPEEEIKF